MPSAIKTSLPRDGDATPQRETRENFVTAASEISALQLKTTNLASNGGIVTGIRTKVPNISGLGAVAYSSLGTATTPVAGTVYFTEVFIHGNKTITGIGTLINANAGTDKVIVSVFDAAGNKLATSALAGVTITGANTFQEVPLTAAYSAVGPNKFWVGVQINGTTARVRTIAASTYLEANTGSVTGTFGTIPATITPTTSITADVGPIIYLYT